MAFLATILKGTTDWRKWELKQCKLKNTTVIAAVTGIICFMDGCQYWHVFNVVKC